MNVEIVHNYVSKNLCNKVGEKKRKLQKIQHPLNKLSAKA